MMKIICVKDYDELSKVAAKIITEQISVKPDSVLGLATGSTPIGTYDKLIQTYKNDEVNFAAVKTFNLDEYIGLARDNPQSYYDFMMEHLFYRVNIDRENIHVPNGTAPDIDAECERYENAIKDAGGIDLQLLGIGQNGHIGFNEPDTVFYNKTRQAELAESTIESNKRFFADEKDIPKSAITMGIGTIMAARKIILIAGADKSKIINELKKEVVTPHLPASILHYHPDATIIYVEDQC